MYSLPRITFKFSSHPPAHTMAGSNVIQYSLLIRRKHTIYFLPALAAEHGFQYLHYFHSLHIYLSSSYQFLPAMLTKEFLRHRKHFLAHIPAKVLRLLPIRVNPERL